MHQFVSFLEHFLYFCVARSYTIPFRSTRRLRLTLVPIILPTSSTTTILLISQLFVLHLFSLFTSLSCYCCFFVSFCYFLFACFAFFNKVVLGCHRAKPTNLLSRIKALKTKGHIQHVQAFDKHNEKWVWECLRLCILIVIFMDL